MLYVLFQLGNDRYALEARRIVEVVPLLALKKIPLAPIGLAGIINYRGQPVPALDLCELTFGRPVQERLSTRIIIIDADFTDALPSERQRENRAAPVTTQPTSLVGLIAERATETLRRDPREFVAPTTASGMTVAPFLGPVLMDDRGVVQLLHVQHLLTGKMRDFAALAGGQ